MRIITIAAVLETCLACAHTESVESVIQTSSTARAAATPASTGSHFVQTILDNAAKLHREAFIIAAQRQGVAKAGCADWGISDSKDARFTM